jgi:chaperonin GroEL
LIIDKIETDTNPNSGWNFKIGEMTDMLAQGIIDPAKVTKTSLQNAVSVSSTLLTTNNAVVEV